MRRIETMKRFATTTWYVLVAVLMWGTVVTPGMVLCVTEGGTAIEWAPGGSCAPGVASTTREVGSGTVDSTCGPCFDVPVGESQLQRSSDRPQRVTMTSAPASPAVLCILLPSSREFQPGLSQQPPLIADSLRGVVLLI
jgi:hypothetical protein